ncbi:hypothetical protein [Abiotrophia defectiva]|uniref:hypothetical protein n=1 Tax=Abiotrophia defectiva TaxID=46125 RepID=UPI00204A77DB|nr:hypothetical protein [Abiotrophia defectiva]DAK48419.1 MAG TPA: hypothetical protein [Caudoviricetes sp.]
MNQEKINISETIIAQIELVHKASKVVRDGQELALLTDAMANLIEAAFRMR